MPVIRCYTRPGIGTYPEENYPGHTALLCDLEHAMHLAWIDDGQTWHPLRNDTGILFPACTWDEGQPQGTTKPLLNPFPCRARDGSFLILAIRRGQNKPDPATRGRIMLFTSPDMVHYTEAGFLPVSEEEISRPACRYDRQQDAYILSWEEAGQRYTAASADLQSVGKIQPTDEVYPAPEMKITGDELAVLRGWLDEITNIGVAPLQSTVPCGTALTREILPKATCLYSDGSTHDKPVNWDAAALAAVDTGKPGVWQIPGTIRTKVWENPCTLGFGAYRPEDVSDPNVGPGMSDPCITFIRGPTRWKACLRLRLRSFIVCPCSPGSASMAPGRRSYMRLMARCTCSPPSAPGATGPGWLPWCCAAPAIC